MWEETEYAPCPYDDCVNCAFRCVPRESHMFACGVVVDDMGRELPACTYCERKNPVSTQDAFNFEMDQLLNDTFQLTDELIFGVEEHKEDGDQVFEAMTPWMDEMDAQAAKFTNMTPLKRTRDPGGFSVLHFKPFSKRIKLDEREDFKAFLNEIF